MLFSVNLQPDKARVEDDVVTAPLPYTILQPTHCYATYALYGPDELSGEEVASIIARAAGSPVTAGSVPIPAFLDVIGDTVYQPDPNLTSNS